MRLFLTKYGANGRVNAVELTLDGVAGLADAPTLRKILRQLLQQGYKTVLVNVRRLRSMDRACWGHLVSAARRLRRGGGRMVLRNCPEALYTELQAQDWHQCFQIPEHHDAGSPLYRNQNGGRKDNGRAPGG